MSIDRRAAFEQVILPHLGAAYSLARWLLRHPQDAEDAVQESLLKALKGFGGYTGGSAQAWLLAIVRNCCLTMLEARKADGKVVVLQHAMDASLIERLPAPDIASQADNRLVVEEERLRVRAAIAALPVQLREVVVLREFHDHSYREIADIVGAPIGTVMSRLARARERLAGALREQDSTENGRKA